MVSIKDEQQFLMYIKSQKINYKEFDDNGQEFKEESFVVSGRKYYCNPNLWKIIFDSNLQPAINYLFTMMTAIIDEQIIIAAIDSKLNDNNIFRLIKIYEKNRFAEKDEHIDFDMLMLSAISSNRPSILNFILTFVKENELSPKWGTWGNACNGRALTEAAKVGNINMTRVLLLNDADIHKDDDWAYIMAIKRGWYNIARLLIDYGADIHAKGNLGYKLIERNDKAGLIPIGEIKEAHDSIIDMYRRK